MNILVLNGSPRSNGNTAAMVSVFSEGATENGHQVTGPVNNETDT